MIQPSLITVNLILYIEIPQITIEKLLVFHKATEYKFDIRTVNCISVYNQVRIETKILLTTKTHEIRNLNLIKYVWDLCAENDQTPIKDIKDLNK